MEKKRKEEDYEMVIAIPWLINRNEIVEKYLDVLRKELFKAIASNDLIAVTKYNNKIMEIKKAPNK